MSPSVVNSSKPREFKSKRPTATHRPRFNFGKRANTVGRPCGSSRVVSSPSGLW